MKILQVNCVYGTGSTGKIVQGIHQGLQDKGIASVVCYGRGKTIYEPNVHKICGEIYAKCNNAASRITGLMYGGCFCSTSNLLKIIRDEQPDVVHLHCINGYFVNIYRLVNWLKTNRIRTVLTLHAEFMYTANCGHALDCNRWKHGCGRCPRLHRETKSLFLDNTSLSWQKMKQAFCDFGDELIVTAVSPWLMDRSRQAPILRDKHHCVVLNGVDTRVFHPYDTSALKEKYGLTNERILFHATPNFQNDPEHIKGGYYIIKLAQRLAVYNIKIFVAGKAADNIQVPDNIILLGMINDYLQLAQYYSMADATILTSKKETFSMVTAESLCCGTPVIGFEAGAPEQIAIPEYSSFVPWGDIEKLTDTVMCFLERTSKKEEIANTAAHRYSEQVMVDSYIKIYEALGDTK